MKGATKPQRGMTLQITQLFYDFRTDYFEIS